MVKKPSSYGLAEMKEIMQSEIHFKLSNQQLDEIVPVTENVSVRQPDSRIQQQQVDIEEAVDTAQEAIQNEVPEVLMDMLSSECADSLVCDELYTISYLKDCRKRKGKKEYFVVWDGYPEEEGTWESATNIQLKIRQSFQKLIKPKK